MWLISPDQIKRNEFGSISCRFVSLLLYGIESKHSLATPITTNLSNRPDVEFILPEYHGADIPPVYLNPGIPENYIPLLIEHREYLYTLINPVIHKDYF